MSLDQLPLDTRSLRIRRAVPGDAAGVFALSLEPAYRTWLPSQVYADEAQARAALEFLIGQDSTPADPRTGACVLMVEHRAEGALIGHVGFSPFEGEVEVGFAIGERHQGRGLATEAVTAASRWAIATFGLGRILGIAAAANVASQRTLARSGFSHLEDRVTRFQGSEQRVSVFAMEACPLPARIAALEAADAPAYRALMLEAYAEAEDAFTATVEERAGQGDEWWARRVADPDGRSLGFGAFEDDRLVGAVVLEFSSRPKTLHTAVLVGMYVRPSHRGTGVADELVRAAIDRCVARGGIRTLKLTVTEGNEPAIRLYRAHGFVPFGTEPMAVLTSGGYRAKVHLWRPIPKEAPE